MLAERLNYNSDVFIGRLARLCSLHFFKLVVKPRLQLCSSSFVLDPRTSARCARGECRNNVHEESVFRSYLCAELKTCSGTTTTLPYSVLTIPSHFTIRASSPCLVLCLVRCLDRRPSRFFTQRMGLQLVLDSRKNVIRVMDLRLATTLT